MIQVIGLAKAISLYLNKLRREMNEVHPISLSEYHKGIDTNTEEAKKEI